MLLPFALVRYDQKGTPPALIGMVVFPASLVARTYAAGTSQTIVIFH
jgi:hypothetical protein